MFYIPEFNGSLAHWVALLLFLASPLFFITEATGWFSFGYSKFARQKQRFSLPSRVGMFIIYAPAVVIAPATYYAAGAPESTWHTLAVALVSLHFGKRCVETLFVHKYSGVMNGWTAGLICFLYSTLAWGLAEIAAADVTPALANSEEFQRFLAVGLLIWVVGQFLNLWHHLLLARLRKPGEKGYKLPRGGLFGLVACPHYLGEIIAWIGYSIFYHHIAAAALTVTMTLYLLGRSHNTVKWYRDRVEGIPQGWKRVIPGVY